MIRLRHLAAINPVRGGRAALRRIRATDSGQSLVEFAMVLPLFLVLLFGLVDFGRAFYSWMIVTNAAREGARAGAVQQDWSTMQTAIYSSMCNPYPSSCSLPPAKLTLTQTGALGARGSQVDVTVSYAFTYATPLGNMLSFLRAGALATPTISSHAAMRLE